MVYSASGRFYGGAPVDEPRSAPLACFKADIATVAGGSQWGAWRFSSYATQPAHEVQCRVANGITIEHKLHGRWFVVWEGSEGYPPTHTTREGSITLQGVLRRSEGPRRGELNSLACGDGRRLLVAEHAPAASRPRPPNFVASCDRGEQVHEAGRVAK
jgi:hypothetical protein